MKSKTSNSSFLFIREWFQRCAKRAAAQGRLDAAALWKDGLHHLDHQQETIHALSVALETAIAGQEDAPWFDEAYQALARGREALK